MIEPASRNGCDLGRLTVRSRRNGDWTDRTDERSGETEILDLAPDHAFAPARDAVVKTRSGRAPTRRVGSFEQQQAGLRARRAAAADEGLILDDRLDGRRVYPEPPRRPRSGNRLTRFVERLTPLMLPFALIAWTRASMIAADWWTTGGWTLQALALALSHAIYAAGLCLVPAAVLAWRPDAPKKIRLLFVGAALWAAAPALGDAAWWLANRSPGTLDRFGYPAAGLVAVLAMLAGLGAVAIAFGLQRQLRRRDGWFDGAKGRGIGTAVLIAVVAAGRLIPAGDLGGTISGAGTSVSRAGPVIGSTPLEVANTFAGLAAPFVVLGLVLAAATAIGALFGESQRRFWQGVAIGTSVLAAAAASNLPSQLDGGRPPVGTFADASLPGLVEAIVLAGAVLALHAALWSPVWSLDVDADATRQGAPDEVFVWGPTSRAFALDPVPMRTVVAVAAGADHSLAVDASGRVAAWGDDGFGQIDVPPDLRDVVSVAGGDGFSVALRADGTIAAWGANHLGQSTPPTDLRGVRAIAAGRSFGLALCADGTVVGWGDPSSDVLPVPEGLSGVTAISAGQDHALALRADGNVVAWGNDATGQVAVPLLARGAKAISAGGNFSLALRADGTVVAWGDGSYGQLDVPEELSRVVAISAGTFHALALVAGGSVVGWGGGGQAKGESTHPWPLIDFKAVAAGNGFSLGVRAA